MMSVSVFFPCFNDAHSIGKLIRQAVTVLEKHTSNYEVIVVDDGSTDSSVNVIKKLQKKYQKLKLIQHKKNRGYGGALKTGFKHAKKDFVFYTDGDGQYDVSELEILLRLMTKDVDIVNGIKMSRNDPAYRIWIGNFYSFVIRWVFWLPIVDVDCDFRLIRRKILKKITLTSNSGSICVELIKKSQRAGAVFRQVSVHHLRRSWGESQFFVPKRLLSTFGELTKLWLKLMVFDTII